MLNTARFDLDPMLTRAQLNTIWEMADTVSVEELEYEDD